MSRLPMSGEFNVDDLESTTWAESFSSGRPFQMADALPEQDADPHSLVDEGEIASCYRPEVLARAKHRCQFCQIDLSDRLGLLHAHHPGKDKSSNDPRHLLALCLVCHSEQEGHAFMRNRYPKADFEYVERLQDEKGWKRQKPI